MLCFDHLPLILRRFDLIIILNYPRNKLRQEIISITQQSVIVE